MDVREKLVELLREYDQMRMLRMSIEECADRLIQKGLTVEKCKNDTKCFDFEICLDEKAKEKTERIVDLMTSFYGVDPGYYSVEAYPLASHLIANGVTVQEWISVKDRLPEPFVSVLVQMPGEKPFPTVREGFISNDGIWQSALFRREPGEVTHWQPMPQPPKGE